MRREYEEMSSRIMEHVSGKEYRPERMRKLASAMGIKSAEYSAFRVAVKELMKAGRVVLGGRNQVMLPQRPGVIIGRFRRHDRGFGFVIPENPTEHGDLFIPPGASQNAMTGDTVAARITRRGKGGDETRVEGEIVEIVTRGQNRFVGELVREGTRWVVLPDGTILRTPVLVGDVSATRAKEGDQVVVEITQFPSPPATAARGVIVEVLGRRGDPGIDTISIIRQYQFPEHFPEPVLEDARRAVREHDLEEILAEREDLRHLTIITIDPDDARDFDDAISITPMRGGYELGVHIADVSNYVRANSPLDGEASQRGNSVYLPQFVIPMLPEILSNGLCSLQEGEPRLCKSAFIQYDKHGQRQQTRFANSVIQSAKRLTYRQAGSILDGETNDYPPAVVRLLREMDRLARLIQKRRLGQGMLVLDLPEVELVMNEDGVVTDVEPAEAGFPHTIIEMFMVEANEAVAELMTKLNVPHLRRIHPEPPSESQQKLTKFLSVLGKDVPEDADRHDLMRLLAGVKGKPESFAVNLAVLRSMAQAEYSPKKIGHYALASEAYSHFTSPIRRYPDLVIHRLLDQYLKGSLRTAKQRQSAPSEETLVGVGKQCTYTERRAEDAERELRLVKTLQFLSGRLGEIHDGIVTGVTNVGIFVQLSKYLIDGLIRFDDLADDWWELDPRGGCVYGQRSGTCVKIGDRLKVQIAAVDVAMRDLDLALPEGELEGRLERPRPARPKKREGVRGRGGEGKTERRGDRQESGRARVGGRAAKGRGNGAPARGRGKGRRPGGGRRRGR